LDKLPLSVRGWVCPCYGTSHDQGVNATINLVNYAVSSTMSACGGESFGRGVEPTTKPAPAKQEFNQGNHI